MAWYVAIDVTDGMILPPGLAAYDWNTSSGTITQQHGLDSGVGGSVVMAAHTKMDLAEKFAQRAESVSGQALALPNKELTRTQRRKQLEFMKQRRAVVYRFYGSWTAAEVMSGLHRHKHYMVGTLTIGPRGGVVFTERS